MIVHCAHSLTSYFLLRRLLFETTNNRHNSDQFVYSAPRSLQLVRYQSMDIDRRGLTLSYVTWIIISALLVADSSNKNERYVLQFVSETDKEIPFSCLVRTCLEAYVCS